MNKAIFLDKDGTLIPDIPYNVDPDKITLTPHIAAELRNLKEKGYLLILVSNQSGVARGIFEEKALKAVEEKIQSLLHKEEVSLDAFTYCPHHPEGKVPAYTIDCLCRKPKPGLITDMARKYNIDLYNSWMVGDILHDVEAGNRAGCNTILFDSGNETEWLHGPYRTPNFRIKDIKKLSDTIIISNGGLVYGEQYRYQTV